jgi:hypothetical protein
MIIKNSWLHKTIIMYESLALILSDWCSDYAKGGNKFEDFRYQIKMWWLK